MTKQAENKRNAMAFYNLKFSQSTPRDAVERYVGQSCTQHNPGVADGPEAFIARFEPMAREYPGKPVQFKPAIAEDEYVVPHCRQIWPGDRDYAGIDIFRFDEAGKIVEQWNVPQIIPGTAANPNSIF